ncbi:phosphate transport system permease protein [Lutimaribacter pacificus]|uniref:Phosphate transport system permease protein n=1 Tax=Lutimaribacter pacificus TaxID=391948 RepID=A0A1H0AIA5_9RHOB|nr:phosphate ABC transporter permease subunit PstC [Lutimaribacter pacificus]SDN33302.1 phosphate transport system permease protein [Lutimaribacter pacificus]SHJ68763.1 phosphate ABC transporter membrane protein 1, PhoT family [Lutimaribacter pacificus]
MPVFWLALIVLALAAAGFLAGRVRALSSGGGNIRNLHSLPAYYGWHVALMVLVPSFLILIVWLLVQPVLVNNAVSGLLPDRAVSEDTTLGLVMSDVRRVADGLDAAVSAGAMTPDEAQSIRSEFTNVRDKLGSVGVALGSDVSPEILSAAQKYRGMTATGRFWMTVVVLAAAVGGFAFALRRTSAGFRARNVVESGIRALLLGAASIAVLTTIGIVLSLVFNTIEFFRLYPAADFFFGLTWAPSFGGGSQLGILPLLWGTFYISFIALAVAVPIGLFAAIYLSEYAGPKVRAMAKPLLEVLAGIPTIVYGLFALLTVGPLLLGIFGGQGLGWMQAGTAVMTAGIVMGIMLIPFVSSLSDDIINAVPQSMRDGSYGLGATKSETIRQVVIPAALPGIVGAVLLAASRAIGETMIVVLGAGAAARLSMNPFDAMTTVTAKIVSQLTGDADFASPEALVAFALGMTLFIVTLGLNVLALYIVRKYREQYE